MAEMEQETAETQLGIAMTQKGTAEDEYGDAKTAMGDAATYADRHVMGLFVSANAYTLDPLPSVDPTNTEAEELAALAKARADQVANAAAAIKNAAGNANNSGSTPTDGDANPTTTAATATATWPNDLDSLLTTPDDVGDGMLNIVVTVDGTALPFDEVNDEETTGDQMDERTAKLLPGNAGLGDFQHGYEITNGDGDTHVIVFSDITQQGNPTPEIRVDVTDRAVTDHTLVSGTPTIIPDTMVFPGEYDHDGDMGAVTGNLTGTFTCAEDCTVQHEDGEVTEIDGYTFTGSLSQARAARPADMDYLVFGIWLTETDGDGTARDTYELGAFEGGGSTAAVADVVTGTATYNGSAAGMVASGGRVDYFEGTATLDANFGAADAPGTVTGIINATQVSGGQTVPDIHLYLNDQDGGTPVDNNITNAGVFDGRTVMDRMAYEDGEDGERNYTYVGMWAGQFYNGDEDETVQPSSAAGTFGATGGTGATAKSVVGAFGAHQPE
jgi:hypothetical protein